MQNIIFLFFILNNSIIVCFPVELRSNPPVELCSRANRSFVWEALS